MGKTLEQNEIKFITDAFQYLENPSLIMRLVNIIGEPIEFVQKRLPEKTQGIVTKATFKAINVAFETSLKTTPKTIQLEDNFESMSKNSKRASRHHTIGAGVTGAAGGFFGAISLPVELPITTGIMLRSISEAGRNFGFDPRLPEFKTECLYVFTLGSNKSNKDDEMESAYYTSRIGLSHFVQQASTYLAEHSATFVLEGVKKGTAPIVVELIAAIAARFEVAVTEKMLLEAVPVLGALGGAAVNSAFTDHFSTAAYYHFGLKRLEAIYTPEKVQEFYESLNAKKAS